MSFRRLATALVAPAFLLGLGCTFILTPDEDQDGVVRCSNVEDCPAPADGRFAAECVHGEGQDESTDKVCAPVFAEVKCDPTVLPAEWALGQLYTSAVDSNGVYVTCTEENRGKRGCPPVSGVGCDQGLELNDAGTCDEPGASRPAILASGDNKGLDVRDQYCAFYFCDSSFVCDGTGSQAICKPCNANAEIGQGGCGQIYVQGEPSSVYLSQDQITNNCKGGSPLQDDPDAFGPLNTPVGG